MLARVLLFAVVSSACGLRTRSDGGVIIDDDSGTPVTPHDGGSQPGDDAGTKLPDAGTARSFTWGKLSAPTANAFRGIGGVGSGSSVVLYTAQHSSRVARFANGTWTTAYTDPANTNLASVWVSPNEEVFAVGSYFIDSCRGGCGAQASWLHETFASVTFTGVCGTDLDHLYAVGNSNLTVGMLLKYDPAVPKWNIVLADTGSYSNAGCWVSSDGTVFIAAQSKVVVYSNGVATPETIEYPAAWTSNEISTQYFTAVSGFGTEVYATGARKRVLRRDAPGHWQFVLAPDSAQGFEAIAVGSNGVVAAGTSGMHPSIAVGTGLAWRFDANGPDISVLSAWFATPDEVYLVGSTTNGGTGVVYRGTR